MTAQFEDVFRLRGADGSLIGVSGSGLFDPAQVGITPQGHCTACYRGFVCEYDIGQDGLFLTRLLVMADRSAIFPPIDGIAPKPSEPLWEAEYKGIRLLVPFEGGLLFGRGFIRDLYVHMGFQKPHAFEEVREVIFSRGKLRREADHSAMFRQMREALLREADENSNARPDRPSIAAWVDTCFDLDYRKWAVFRDPDAVLAGEVGPYALPED